MKSNASFYCLMAMILAYMLTGCSNHEEKFSGYWICSAPNGDNPGTWEFDSEKKVIKLSKGSRGVDFSVDKNQGNQYWLTINHQSNRKAIFKDNDNMTIHDSRDDELLTICTRKK